MFGKKVREEARLLKARVDSQATHLDTIKAALNDLTRLVAKKHRLKLDQPMFYPYGYNHIERLATHIVTTHVKDD